MGPLDVGKRVYILTSTVSNGGGGSAVTAAGGGDGIVGHVAVAVAGDVFSPCGPLFSSAMARGAGTLGSPASDGPRPSQLHAGRERKDRVGMQVANKSS